MRVVAVIAALFPLYSTQSNVCGSLNGDYFVVSVKSFSNAAEVCHLHGGELAEINSHNIKAVSSRIALCASSKDDVYVHSWNGEAYYSKCPAMSASEKTIKYVDCNKATKALCKPSSDGFYRARIPVQFLKLDTTTTETLTSTTTGSCTTTTACETCTSTTSCLSCSTCSTCPTCSTCSSCESCSTCSCNTCTAPCGCNCEIACQTLLYSFAGTELPDIPGAYDYYSATDTDASVYVATDGTLLVVGDMLQVNSNPFVETYNNPFDRFKYFIVFGSSFAAQTSQEASFMAVISAHTNMTDQSPFTSVQDPASDFRLGYAGFTVFDESSELWFSYFITNDTVFAGYERYTPFGVTSPYAMFTFAMPLISILPDSIHTYAINFNAGQKSVRWIVDGVEVYKIYSIGSFITNEFRPLLATGTEDVTFPNQVRIGFGTFDFLEAYSPCVVTVPAPFGGTMCSFPALSTGLVQLRTGLTNPFNGVSGAVYESTGVSPGSRIWGQGVTMYIANVTVGQCNPTF